MLPLLLLLLILLGGTSYTLIRSTNSANDLALIPELVGASSIEEAQGIAGENFEVVESDGVESQEPVGAVVDQKPAPGEMADEGSTISVNVSSGVNVPDVRGEARDEAVQILEGMGFEVEAETVESSADNKNYVVEQNPQGGRRAMAESGSTVTIVVGAGPANQGAQKAKSPGPEQAPVPQNTGKKAEQPKVEPPPENKTKEPEPELLPPHLTDEERAISPPPENTGGVTEPVTTPPPPPEQKAKESESGPPTPL